MVEEEEVCKKKKSNIKGKYRILSNDNEYMDNTNKKL